MTLSALTAYAVASALASVCIGLTWERLTSAFAKCAPVTRARLLLTLRLTPALLGVLGAALALLGFARYEPVATDEAPGWILIAGAAVSGGVILAAISRVVERWARTYQFLKTIEPVATRVNLTGVGLPAWQVETRFPLIALAGIWRPRVLVARTVVAQMPADELRVVVRHELAHARHRDNLAQVLLTATPDLLFLGERWLRIEQEWREAVEDAADDFATKGDADARLNLASALVRVSRMAGEQSQEQLPLLAFHEGESIERRVRRLVDLDAPSSTALIPAVYFAMFAVAVALSVLFMQSDAVLVSVHEVIEWLVKVGA